VILATTLEEEVKDISQRDLFQFDIHDWETWGRVFRSTDLFTPLVKRIFAIEGLDFTELENCKPGTNGVFRVGDYIAKVFVPLESGYDSEPDYRSELYALHRANSLGVSVPRLVANGAVQDRYLFRYLIMDYVAGETLGDIKSSLAPEHKVRIGESLRRIVHCWATPCEDFNGVDAIARTLASKRWIDASVSLRAEQQVLLSAMRLQPQVYVHGDLTEDNLIVTGGGAITVVDFADSLRAPAIYEDMTIICDAFSFDSHFLRGYYGNRSTEELADLCFKATLCHEYGYNVIRSVLGVPSDCADLKRRIMERLSG
jgi:tRNA A-37 threonylcarbamoyl transferase component Bud32